MNNSFPLLADKLEEEFALFQRLTLGQPQTFSLKGLLDELEPQSEAKHPQLDGM